MTIKIIPNEHAAPAGKLADAELHFNDIRDVGHPLQGLKLIGFGIWSSRARGVRTVTFPARQYSVNGERRSFALLRPADSHGTIAQDRVRDLILRAYALQAGELSPAELTDDERAANQSTDTTTPQTDLGF